MASSGAKKEAKNLLGKFDSSGYKEQKSAAKSMYDTSLADAENQWTNLQNRLTANRKASATDFSRGRSNVSESDYLANRVNANRRATGGIDKTGFDTASDLGSRMELGRQYSNLANTYYNALEGIDRSETEGQQAYDIARRQAGDIYNSALANINLAKQGAQNQYNAQLASLAEGIQSRWDANANAAAALQAQKDQYASDLAFKKAGFIKDITSGLSGDSDNNSILQAYNSLRAIGLKPNEIENILKQSTGLNNLVFSINSSGNPSVNRVTPTITVPSTPTVSPQSTATTASSFNPVSPTPYQDLLNRSNPYFNR